MEVVVVEAVVLIHLIKMELLREQMEKNICSMCIFLRVQCSYLWTLPSVSLRNCVQVASASAVPPLIATTLQLPLKNTFNSIVRSILTLRAIMDIPNFMQISNSLYDYIRSKLLCIILINIINYLIILIVCKCFHKCHLDKSSWPFHQGTLWFECHQGTICPFAHLRIQSPWLLIFLYAEWFHPGR